MLRDILENEAWLLSLIIINIGGFFFGMYYYVYQLSLTTPLLWIFVIDCPLYVILFASVCIMLYRHREVPPWFLLLVAVGLMKYGLWTVVTIFLYMDYLLGVNFVVNGAMPFLHAGMILEAIVLLPRIKPRLWQMLAVLGWFLLNDFSDYFLMTVPMLPPTHLPLLMWESILATLILAPALYLIGKRWR